MLGEVLLEKEQLFWPGASDTEQEVQQPVIQLLGRGGSTRHLNKSCWLVIRGSHLLSGFRLSGVICAMNSFHVNMSLNNILRAICFNYVSNNAGKAGQ